MPPFDLTYLADINEVAETTCEITSSGPWSELAPLDAMKTFPINDRAISSGLGTANEPEIIEFEYEYPINLTYAALFNTNAEQTARVRLECFLRSDRTGLLLDTRRPDGTDLTVIPGLSDPADLQPIDPNFLTGQLPPRDFRLYATHIHVRTPLITPRVLRWSIYGPAYRDADGGPDTAYRIGHAWAGHGIEVRRVVGTAEGYRDNDELKTAPGGAVWAEPGQGKRTLSLDIAPLDRKPRDAVMDMVRRAGRSKPIVILPSADPRDLFRYGAPYRRAGDEHAHRYLSPEYAQAATMQFAEWTE